MRGGDPLRALRARGARVRSAWAGASIAVVLLAGCGLSSGEERPGGSSDAPSAPGLTTRPDVTEFVQDLGEGTSLADQVDLAVSLDAIGGAMRDENVGISLEATDLADVRLDPANSSLDDRLNELGSPALRFGGNRLDRNMFWTSTQEVPPTADAVVVDPEDLERLRRLTDATNASVTLGIPFGDFDPERGADMAAHAQRILGDALVGVSIGNEPNGYTVDGDPNHRLRDDSWDVGSYVDQLEVYAAAVESAAPGVPIIGPGAYDALWLRGFAESNVRNKTAVSQHWYALYDCASREIPGRGPRAQNLVDPLLHESARQILGIGLDVSAEAGLPLWLEETGPTSCPGTNDTSRTQAKALWTVDFALHAAQMGVQRTAMHSMLGPCRGGAPMSLVCAVDEGSSAIVGQNNHAALRLAAMSVGGDFVSVDGVRDDLRAYAVHVDPSDRIVLTLVNNSDAAEVDATPVTVDVPEGFEAVEASQVSGERLTEPVVSDYLQPLPLPEVLPYSGSGESSSGIALDVDASSATVVVFDRRDAVQPDATS